MAARKENNESGWNEAGGIVLIALAVLLLLSIFSYDPNDVAFNQSPPNSPPANFIGPVGAYAVFALYMSIGIAAYPVPLALALMGLGHLLRRSDLIRRKGWFLLSFLLAFACIAQLQDLGGPELLEQLNISGNPGGFLGNLLGEMIFAGLIGEVGTLIVAWSVLLASLVLLTQMHPLQPFKLVAAGAVALFKTINAWILKRSKKIEELQREERAAERERRKLERALERERKAARKEEMRKAAEAKKQPEPPAPPKPEPARKAPPKKARPADDDFDEMKIPEIDCIKSDFRLPPIELLDPLPPESTRRVKVDVESSRRILEETLRDFNIDATVTGVDTGPVVTRYEVLPPPGIRVEKIAGLSNNIALALKAESVRVQAPIPGKGVVGIEIPNSKSTAVYLREVLESEEWRKSGAALPLALGKDVSGKVVVADLADMPHLLIAGATGAGKTVCMNSILTGLLMARKPEEMRLMLIDPKIVEFSNYNHMPHLVVPVITNAKKVGLGFRWVINEMEKRYKLFNKAKVRNIKAFNSRPIVKQTELFDDGVATRDKNELPETVPYIVVVVDELADLMAVAQAEIENSIARLAQLSRAVGIHMILATQRPSVNIITGTIKANFPARIAFQVAQKVDSRTIIDTIGADKLLGKGDMLFMPPGSSKIIRSQGAYANDDEINRVIEFIKEQGTPEYETEVQEKIEGSKVDVPEIDEDDDLLSTAVEIIRQTRRASTSSLQRRLRIGYTRAARLMDILEEQGLIGPPNGSEPREILIDLDGDIPENSDDSGGYGADDEDGASDEYSEDTEED
jgi:DNA segregation ATPase FtsK/SpoIIIE, S-DNA-T family